MAETTLREPSGLGEGDRSDHDMRHGATQTAERGGDVEHVADAGWAYLPGT